MGRLPLVSPFCVAAFVIGQAPPTPLRPAAATHPEVVLAPDDGDGLVAACGLGDGGVANTEKRLQLSWTKVGCATPGGVQIEAQRHGVKLTFPSGRELLIAPDGHLHLRSGEQAGPFVGGVALHLADGSSVRTLLPPGQDERLRDVVVVHGERALQPWRRGKPASELPRAGVWSGLHLFVCGDGGDLYRAIALGPLVVLDRQLVAKERAERAPTARLVLITGPLRQSMQLMPRQHREPDAPVRQAVAAVTAVADRADLVFPEGAALRRAEPEQLRWLAGGGFELQLEREGPLSPRLQLFAGMQPVPMLEWTLRADSAAFLTNPRSGEIGQRWHGNGTRLRPVARALQARVELFELPYALRVLERLRRSDASAAQPAR
jgi:hypothetical protein